MSMRARGSQGRSRLHKTASTMLLPALTANTIVSAYLGALTVVAWRAHRARPSVPTHRQARHRFAVLIPAHNEEQLIAGTLKSLGELDYPTTHYAIHVVADNCTDATAGVAASFGAEVHERNSPEAPGKGPALTWLLERLQARRDTYDAVMILDADSVVSRNFLTVMDGHLARGERAIQSYYAVRDDDRSWLVGLRAAALAVRHYLRPMARTSLGGSAGLRGNGMVFRSDLIEGRVWSAHLTEDLEFEAQLLLDGERVTFAPDAVVQAEMPQRLVDATTQNHRWERGRLQVARKYAPALLRASLRRGTQRRIACVDAATDHLLPPASVLAGATALMSVVSGWLWMLRPTRLSRFNFSLAVGAAVVQGAQLLSGLRMVRAPASVWRSLPAAPVYVAWKTAIWLRAGLTAAPDAWIRTPRNVRR